jgi:hypothetical protein
VNTLPPYEQVVSTPRPPGWGGDDLSQFLDFTRHNQFATFHAKKVRYAELSTLDACFYTVAKNITNPANAISPVLFYRCHSAFRCACATTMAGQIAETFVLLRSCLEYAAYGFAMFIDPALTMVWLNRHQDDKAKKASVQEFQIKNIRGMIDQVDTRLTAVFQELYDRAVDFGAHPNERAATSNMAINQEDDMTYIVQQYIQGDGLQLEHGLKSTAQVGVCCLQLFQHAYYAKFMLLGVRDTLIDLRQNHSL